MIWFPTYEQNFAQNCYFDIRDAEIQYRHKTFSGMVSGILGIDEKEFWAEISIGTEWAIQILPIWNDDGQVDNLPESLNPDLLKTALADEVKKVLPDFRPVRYSATPHYSEQFSFPSLVVREQHAA